MATTKQNQMIAGRMVEFQDRFSSLSNDDAQYIIQNAGDAIGLFICAIVNRSKSAVQAVVSILSAIVATFSVSSTTEKFVAKDKFKVDTGKKAKVKISYLGDNFKEWFLGKTEDPFAGSTIYGRKLEKNSVDGPILQELGGNEAAETTLTEIYAAMEAQSNGENGDSLINGWVNIFYIKDVNGTLRAVSVRWGGDGWGVFAGSVGGPDEWLAGGRVFSRNSLAPQAS
ncbi:MAG: hypothetical protein WC458_02520 [Patescibacteria group bacterium]